MEFWVILVGFRQWKNGQKWKNTVNSDFLKGFWMPEHWKHCKNQCFGPTLCRKTCKLRCFWRKTTMFLKDFLYICLSWPAALEHGKIEENCVSSNVFKGLGRQGNVLEPFYGDKCVNYRVLKENIAKTCKHTSKTRDLEDFVEKMHITVQNVVWTVFLGVVVVAIWNSLAWEARTRGKR